MRQNAPSRCIEHFSRRHVLFNAAVTRGHYQRQGVMYERATINCWICGKPLPPEECKTDDRGRPIHENCYITITIPTVYTVFVPAQKK